MPDEMSRDLSYPVSFHVILYFSICSCPADKRARRNGVADLKHAPPHVCYQAEHGRSALKDVGKIQENPKIGER